MAKVVVFKLVISEGKFRNNWYNLIHTDNGTV